MSHRQSLCTFCQCPSDRTRKPCNCSRPALRWSMAPPPLGTHRFVSIRDQMHDRMWTFSSFYYRAFAVRQPPAPMKLVSFRWSECFVRAYWSACKSKLNWSTKKWDILPNFHLSPAIVRFASISVPASHIHLDMFVRLIFPIRTHYVCFHCSLERQKTDKYKVIPAFHNNWTTQIDFSTRKKRWIWFWKIQFRKIARKMTGRRQNAFVENSVVTEVKFS